LIDGLVGVNQIARPDRRAEAEFRGIGLFDGFIDGLEGVNRKRRTKNFFLGDAGIVGNVAEQGRQIEIALVQVTALGPLAAENRLGAAGLGILYLLFDFLPLGLQVNWTHAGLFVRAVPNGFLFENFHQA